MQAFAMMVALGKIRSDLRGGRERGRRLNQCAMLWNKARYELSPERDVPAFIELLTREGGSILGIRLNTVEFEAAEIAVEQGLCFIARPNTQDQLYVLTGLDVPEGKTVANFIKR